MNAESDATELALNTVIVEVVLGEAAQDFGSIMVFVRGEKEIDTLCTEFALHTRSGEQLQEWRVISYFSQSDSDEVMKIIDDSLRVYHIIGVNAIRNQKRKKNIYNVLDLKLCCVLVVIYL